MTTITKYIADDGTEFNSSLECAEYENKVDDILNDYVGQLKWERDVAMETLRDIGIPFGHKYKDITYEMGINSIAKLLNEGNARVIQTGGFAE